ncbi:hypothetical protein [Paenibacillus sacheonensis]|uniref:Uncharacterized protein n=1 Tax=Paenibacillus sacheonensis TaxID=742054 RepID=A0A7X4YV32_9BACL|nr:hypothetical protein [Paenibacillus sacheonensis]MBM7566603.1 hypothetical protein [Paenibacillus sacheonensis]NBC73102.1 hypothetical protein [Paenibacillus sacheonensis]
MTDTVIVFPHCAWEAFPYGGFIERLGRGRSVRFVASTEAMAGAPPQYGAMTLDDLDAVPWQRTIVIATHPSWVYEIAGRSPAALLVLLPSELEQGEADYLVCRDALCAAATVVVTGSETYYFEQWFRRGRVFLQDGLDTASDLLADAAASDAAAGKSVDALAKLQLQRRADFRAEQLRGLRPSAMQFFFQSVYHYLLGQGEEAERWALDAFHLAILSAEEGAVQTYFRFLSVIRLQQGRANDAFATYGISAASDEERGAYGEMLELQASGEAALAAGLLYRMNEDFRQTAGLLNAAPAQLPDGPLRERAVSLLVEAHERSSRPGAALALLPPPRTVKERLRRNLLEGRAYALEGRRHDAVRALLQAAMTGLEPLHAIADIAAALARAKKLAEGEYT